MPSSPGRGIEVRLKTAEARFKQLSEELKRLTEEKEKKEKEEIGGDELRRMSLQLPLSDSLQDLERR